MKKTFSPLETVLGAFLALGTLLIVSGCGPAAETGQAEPTRTVEAACGGCVYKMDGVESCELAVKIDGKPYLVTGVDFDPMAVGLCKGAKMAEVSGKVEGGKFVATKFTLKP